MAKLTLAQQAKLEAQAPAGWHFYPRHNGDKQLIARVELNPTAHIDAYIEGTLSYEGRDGAWVVVCRTTLWTKHPNDKGFASMGLGAKTIPDQGGYNTRNFKKLCNIGATIAPEKLIDFYRKDLLRGGGIFAPSPTLESIGC